VANEPGAGFATNPWRHRESWRRSGGADERQHRRL